MSKVYLLGFKAIALYPARSIILFPELILQPDPIRHVLVWTNRRIFYFFNPVFFAYPKLAFSELLELQNETCTKRD